MSTLKSFIKSRKIELCTEKTKIVVFNKHGKEKKEVWKWEGREIEETQCFKYLGFTFNRKGDYEDHIAELSEKGKAAAKKVWGLGERVRRNDFIRRWVLFKYLVQSVMGYGVEIWGWEERGSLERIMLDYTRWIFNIEFCTPRYVIMRELAMDKLRIGWGIRAMRYERRIGTRKEDGLLRSCWKEKEESKWKDVYSKEREKFYNRNGWGINARELREGGNEGRLEKEIIRRERDGQRQWEESKLRAARYNVRYKEFDAGNRKHNYLRKENLGRIGIGEGVRGLVRLRCGNMEEGNKYWIEKEQKRCVFCGKETDCMEHYVGECQRVSSWFRELGENKEKVWKKLWSDELDSEKCKVLSKLERERKKEIEKKKKGEKIGSKSIVIDLVARRK
ncbi:hypothetical protein ALC57_04060 [Trachymyrmex cornetzi]|uniref:Reverse transcriptase domain-containing protein n=1 Tax=Trachymyrmex cornetzi TaxID=471704 RepID=A0A151JF22_9HYME|nr:hypothetical protein ALC57_04060 [Trachymyrmex cornetzi]